MKLKNIVGSEDRVGWGERKTMVSLWTIPIPRIFLGILVLVWLQTTFALHITSKIHELTPIYIENFMINTK